MTTLSQAPTALYQGFDSFLGEARDDAVGGKSDLTGGESTNFVSICTDSESVSQAISVSASLSDSAFDVSVDAKASWVQSLSITSTSGVVIVHTVVQQGLKQATSYSLLSTVKGPSSAGVQDFFNHHGDSFVNEIATGAEYYAAFIYDSTTVDTQEQITASLKGSEGVLSASLSTSLNEASSSTSTSMRVSQQMLGASNLSYPSADPDSMVAFADAFPSQTFNAPTVLAFAVMGYERVDGINDFDAVAANRNLLGSTAFADASATLSALASQVALIQQMYGAYQYTGDTDFAGKAAQVTADMATLTGPNGLIAAIEANVTGTFPAPSLPSLGYGTPVVSYTLKPALQTTSSEVFYDLTATQIANGVTPALIVVTSSGFRITYSDGTAYDHGSGGSTVGTLNLQEDGDSISLVGFPPGSQGYQINEIQTAKGKTVGTAGDWNYVKTPPPIIGFAGGYLRPPATSPLLMGTIAITIYPTVWAN